MPHLLTYALTALALFAAIMFVLLYLVAPLAICSKHGMSARRDIAPTAFENLNDMARAGLARAVHDLRAEGFDVVANVTSHEASPNSQSVQALFVHRAHGDSAEGFHVATPAADRLIESWTLSLLTRFDNGFEIQTVSTHGATAFPKDPDCDAINAHWITDGRLLYAIHRARVERSPHAARGRVLPPPGAEIDYLQSEHRRVLDRVTAAGYFRLDAPANKYRMTLKGAYLMTWRILPPLKQWRRAANARRAKRVLREIGFAQYADAPA